MTVFELLDHLQDQGVALSVKNDELVVQGKKQALKDAVLVQRIRDNKPELIALIRSGAYRPLRATTVDVPPNAIPADAQAIAPHMLPLVQLTQPQIDRIVATVPGGAANVQDIYPLAPLQEGILFHHLMARQGDAYLMPTLFRFRQRARVDAFVQALQAVIDRHDILRTAVLWDDLPEPVQVVWRQAPLALEEVQLDDAPDDGDIAERLRRRFDRNVHRIDLRQAPLLRVAIAHDAATDGWALLLRVHHLAIDHTALEIVQHEIQAHMLGQADRLPPPLPFRNFVAQARLGIPQAEHEAFFRQMLGEVTAPTTPFGLVDVQGDGSANAEAQLPVDDALAARLRRAALASNASVASLFHLAWALVVARTASRDDVVFGTLLFGRMQGGEGADRVLGLFINTLPLRVRIDDTGVQDSLREVHRLLARLIHHEHAPLALAQRCSGVAAPAPLFSAVLNYRHSVAQRTATAEERAAWDGIEGVDTGERTNYPFTMTVDDLVEGFALTSRADASLDPQRLCAYMHRALEQLAAALERAPGTPLRSLDVLPDAERHQLLTTWNTTETTYARTQCVHELFEAQAATTPASIALAQGDETLRYDELNARANRLARHLRTLGVAPDTRVAICAERGFGLIVGLLAILKAGGAYVPLDPTYPPQRLDTMLRDSAPAVLLVEGAAPPHAASLTTIDLTVDASQWIDQGGDNLSCADLGLRAEHLAYVIYTSGSTGQSKGVMVEHRSVCNLTHAQIEAFAIQPDSRVLQFASVSFDACVSEVMTTLCRGACLVLAEPGAVLAGTGLVDIVHRQAVSVVTLPPAVLAALPEDARLDSLATLVVAGEACPASVVRRFAAGRRFINAYGPTETTVCASLEVCLADDEAPGIGRPIANTRIYLLDAHREPVPIGVAGELYVGGDSVARGYLNRVELTAERFMADPFHGGRMYRTGDLARQRDDGRLVYLGRNDLQVKLRGYRIELGEIEARLLEHASVRETVVIAREDTPDDKRLVAYYTEATDDSETDFDWGGFIASALGHEGGGEAQEAHQRATALRTHLAASLPEYMLPAAFVRLDALPLTPNGKLDRQALPAPDALAYAARAYEAPEGEIETTLARLWRELLNVGQVGRNDDFFALGGHSLLAVRLVSRLRQALGVEVTLGELFEHPQLRTLAEAIRGAARSALPAITAAARDAALPLSFAQQRLWFLAQLDAESRAYHMPLGLRLVGALDADALQRALARIVARHEALRTVFVREDGQPEQRILPADVGFHLVAHDLRGHADAASQLEALAEAEANAAFDLAQGPLIRGRLVAMEDETHVLLVTMHHIVSDGWSMGVLTRELGALYGAFAEDRDDPLPPLAIQYADYAAWQQRWLEGEVLQRQSEHWKARLSDAPALLDIPADRARPVHQDHTGAVVGIALDDPLSAELHALSRRHGTTLYMTLLTAWSALLSRLSGQDDLVVGTPVANRTRIEVEGLIGFFINTLALRIDASGSPSTAELLQRVKAEALQSQQHQDLPFEQVVELVKPVRSLSHSPLFQVMFAWQNNEQSELDLNGLRVEPVGAGQNIAKYDLTLNLGEFEGRIVGGIEYATALFDRETIERYAGYLQTLLQAMVADEQQPIDRLPLLGDAERHQLLVTWNATATDAPRDLGVHELFAAHAARTPDAPAMRDDHRQLSYAELDARATALAWRLAERGLRPGARVATLLDRSIELVVAQLAILQCGAAHVPLDRHMPAQRRAFIVADSEAWSVIALRGDPTAIDDKVLRIDIDIDAPAAGEAVHPPGHPAPAAGGEAPAYVMYTSGSTGEPRGVVTPHRAIARVVLHNGYADFEATDRVAFAANPVFDASTMEIWAALLNGGCLVVIDQPTLLDPPAFARSLLRHEVSVMWLTVGLFNQYAQALAEVLPRLRCLVVGGDALDAAVIRRVLAHNPPQRLLNGYGPTESTVFAATHEVRQLDATARSVPIGRPIANTRIYLLDAHRQPVPRGVAGELHIAGDGLALGYLNRPALTAERFVEDPFHGGRMYCTGDLARHLSDGSLEFLGRNDFQVKIRGFRIEPGEIEARLAQQPGIREAAVLVREDHVGDKRLVAYVVGDEESTDAATLRTALSGALPDYMVPAAFVTLDRLPLTPNGKLDRKALPAPDAQAYAARAYEAPVGEIETTLARLWGELLDIETVGRHDDFFALGGHSLLAVQLISRLRQELSVELPLGELFEHPRLLALAQALRGAETSTLPAIAPAARDQALPLSFAQQRLWFLAQVEGQSRAYHMPMGLHLRGALDRGALRQALDRIVARHEALRTSFATDLDGQPTQRIAPPDVGFQLHEHDLRTHADPQAEARVLAETEIGARFDPATGPMVRGRLIALGDEEHVLLITMHHIVSDGWSMGIFCSELSALYGAVREGRTDPLPPLAIQYPDYAAWQRQWLSGERLQRQADYWQSTLKGAPALLELPTDRPRPAQQDFAGAFLPIELDPALTQALKALSQQQGTTLFMTVLAAWAIVLSRLSGQHDVVIGTGAANRTSAELENLIGFFVNSLALRIDLADAPDTLDALQRVKRAALGAQACQDLPFEQVVELAQPVRSAAHSPLFQVMFAWQNTDRGVLDFPGLTVSGLGLSLEAVKFDLELTLGESGDRLVGGLGYATALFDAATVGRMVGYLRAALQALLAPSQPIDRIDLLSAGERRLQLVEWNDTAVAFDDTQCIHALFEAQAERTPDAVAVAQGDVRLGYAQLNAQANQLAHFLRDLGVGPDTRVAVCVERRPHLIVALLAILKAGGAYVPLDPGYPAERLAFLVADSDPTVVLVDATGAKALGDGDRGPTLALDAQDLPWSDMPTSNLPAADTGLDPSHIAYVIYTSGSSGRPKGVMVPHRGLVNLAVAHAAAYKVGPESRVLQFVSPSFDVSLSEIVMGWAGGAALWFAETPEELQPGSVLTDTLHRLRITHLSLVASVLGFLSEEATMPGGTLIVGGEPLPPQMAQRWAKHHVLFNNYGPTEATVCATLHRCAPEALLVVPIGRPIANTRIYLLDVHGQPVPIGATGELHIGGAGVASGYLHQPALTAERFVDDPFHGGRMYRTGDLARYLADGRLVFVGRNDFQVKVRGFRIELGEIEARLAEHPAVHEAVVMAREDDGEKRLVAYFSPRADAAPLASRLLRMEQADPSIRAQLYELGDGLPVFHQNKRETDLIHSEIFDSEEYVRNGIRLGDGCCIFDVGANIGLFSLFMARRFARARLFAFEPIAPLYRCVTLNQELHGIEGRAFNVGLSNRNAEATFRFYPKNTAASTSEVSVEGTRAIVRAFLGNDAAANGEAATLDGQSVEDILDARLTYEEHLCQLRRLSDVMAEQSVDRIDLLKIDVEGAELDVLEGIDAGDWPKIGQLAIEVHDIDGRLRLVTDLLEARGFAVSRHQSALLENTGLHTLYAIHESYQPAATASVPATAMTGENWHTVGGLVLGLRAHLARVLPDYAMPAAFVAVPALPLTPNGKLDRAALPRPDGASALQRRYEAPQGEIETALAAMWCELLAVRSVGRHDHFFELGGHSLLALQLIGRVQRDLAVELRLASLFTHATLAALAEVVAGTHASTLPPITSVARDARMPLSFAQQRLWFLAQLDGMGAAYHLPVGLRLAGPLDRRALHRSLDRLVARHEALRTSFISEDGDAYVRFAPTEIGFILHEHDLRGRTDAAAQAEALAASEATDAFDLSEGPLIRGRLIVLGDEDHMLLITMHHIVSDGWSLGVLTQELGALYGAYAEGRDDPLPPLAIQYADYAAWQRRWLEGEVLQRQGAYWKGRLNDAPALLELPADRPRPAQQDHRGAVFSLAFDEELSAGVKVLSRRHGTTLHMTLLAAWSVLLARLSGQDDLVIGTPVANRTRTEVEGLIGFFVNTLALRLNLGGSPGTAELLERVKTEALEAQQHQDLPFEQVVELVNPTRSLAHSPLFQVMFSWQNGGSGTEGLPGLQLRPVTMRHEISKFDLTLHMGDAGGRLSGAIEYATALFDRKTIERFAGYLQTLLRGMVADEHAAVDRLPLLDAAERDLLLVQWNATAVEYPRESCIHTLFEAQVRRTPDAPAVVSEDGAISYGELDARANALAGHLRQLGVVPGSHVAILLDRSLELVQAELAVLKCGAAYVPLDLNAPPERQAFMIGDCRAPVVLSLSHLPVPEHAGTVRVDLDALPILSAQAIQSEQSHSLSPACVMYTSGSTGHPKGVVVPHRALARLVLNNHYTRFQSDDRVAFTSNPAFDSSNMEVWAPLLHGACIVVVSHATLLQPAALADWLMRSRVTILHLVAGLLSAYAEPLAHVFTTLRYLLTGGDVAVPRAIARVLRDSAPQHLIHCYGPSETTTFATTCELSHLADDARSVPIGRPVANTKVYLLDKQGQPVPRGATGELYIGGDGVALGYLNQPALTAERFIEDPFHGGRMYRTGDLARYLPDGNIEFLGRNDFQVKIRGFRIELGEIESKLLQLPGIREAIVLAREDSPGDKRLVAYLVADEVLQAPALRSALSRELPEYMVPGAFVQLDALPLTANGKLDRKALPAPDLHTARYEAPVGKTEMALAGIWAEVLGRERIGRHDHFFELGGHSLLSIRLMTRVELAFGVKFSLSEFLAEPTLDAMAEKVIRARLARFAPDELAALVPSANASAHGLAASPARHATNGIPTT